MELTVTLLVPQIKENIAVVCQALLFQERIREHIVEPSFTESAVVGSGKRVNLAVTWRRSCLNRRWSGREERRMSSFGAAR